MDVKYELDLSEYQWCIKRGDGQLVVVEQPEVVLVFGSGVTSQTTFKYYRLTLQTNMSAIS
jgi:hypothetical protein